MNLKHRWKSYWYEWHSVSRPLIGSRMPQGHYEFRKQRLINVILFTLLIIMLILVIFKL